VEVIMLRRLFWLVAPICIAALACVSASPDESESEAAQAASGNGAGKLTLCHEGDDISVAGPAVSAHLGHGDSIGSCDGDDGGDDDVGTTGGDVGGGGVPACGELGATCTSEADCCSGVCGGSSACVEACNGPVNGDYDGVTCTQAKDCCVGAACIDGFCYAYDVYQTTCALPGTSCGANPCCFTNVCSNSGICQ
jgi:hypothetical protein